MWLILWFRPSQKFSRILRETHTQSRNSTAQIFYNSFTPAAHKTGAEYAKNIFMNLASSPWFGLNHHLEVVMQVFYRSVRSLFGERTRPACPGRRPAGRNRDSSLPASAGSQPRGRFRRGEPPRRTRLRRMLPGLCITTVLFLLFVSSVQSMANEQSSPSTNTPLATP